MFVCVVCDRGCGVVCVLAGVFDVDFVTFCDFFIIIFNFLMRW